VVVIGVLPMGDTPGAADMAEKSGSRDYSIRVWSSEELWRDREIQAQQEQQERMQMK
jgi:uncharacterized protein YjcR